MMLTIGQMNQEIGKRIRQYGLQIDCGVDGSTDASIAVIAEAPGDRERTLKMPLVGGSGKVLWDTIRKYGINRRNVFITNVVKKQLLGSGDAKEKVSDGEFANYCAILNWELSQLPNLKYIICLGNFALQAITGFKGINTYRGSVFPVQLRNATDEKEVITRDVQVLAAYNPAAVLRNPSNELMFKFDMGRFNELVTGKFEEHQIEAIINPSFDEAMAYIERMRQSENPVGLDIETSSGETICVGLSDNIYNGMCINFRDAHDNRFTVKQEMQLWIAIQRLVSDPNVRLVMQNGMYDASWLWFKDRVKIQSFWFDTMLAHHTLYPTLPHNLGFIVSQYTTHPFYKDEGKVWKETGDIDAEWRYNVKDVCLMLAAQQKMLKELEAQQLDEFFFSHVMATQPELVDMTVHGVKIDTVLKERIVVDMRAKIKTMKEQYYDMVAKCTGDPEYRPNPSSPKQMGELFFKKLKLVGRGTATDKENRRRMRDHPRTPDDAIALLNHIDALAEEQKFVSTYAEMSIDDDGRVRCEYKQMGVVKAPGRLSSASTGWGTGCMPLDAKAYTPNGWVEIKDRPPIIAQYNTQGEITFVRADWNIFDYEGLMYGYEGRCFRGVFTPNHRIIGIKRDKLYEVTAERAASVSGMSIPCTGNLLHGVADDETWLRTWVMLSADGCLENGVWRISVKKKKKAIRIAEILDRQLPEQDSRGYYRFGRIKDKGYTKELDLVVNLDYKSRLIVLDELKYWDAHVRGNSYMYYTTIPSNAETVQTLAHITGMTASITIDETNSNEHGNTSTKPLYTVNVSPKTTNFVEYYRWIDYEYSGKVGCPSVESGMWLVKYKDGIHVTGNSNLQNQPARAHEMFIADEGYEFSYFDLSQAEARIVGWLAPIPTWITDFERARIEGGFDCHRSLAAQMFNMAYDDTPTEDIGPDGKHTKRYIAKRCRHGLNYRMMPDRLATTLHVPYSEAEYLWHLYHKINPELQQWWKATVREVKEKRSLWTPYGRRWILLEQFSDEATESIIAFKPQSTIGDKVTRIIRLCHNDPDWPRGLARIALNVHDCLIAINHTSVGQTVRAIMKKHAEEPILIKGYDGVTRELIIPADLKKSMPDDNGVHRWSSMVKVKL